MRTMQTPIAPEGAEKTTQYLALLWPFIQTAGRDLFLPVEVLLAIGCVETAGVPTSCGAIFMSNQALGCLARWYPELDPNPVVIDELAYGAAHLAQQLRRFGRLPLALAAYHYDPEIVADQGEAFLDRPEVREYLRYFFAVLAWLADTQPWRKWDRVSMPEVTS